MYTVASGCLYLWITAQSTRHGRLRQSKFLRQLFEVHDYGFRTVNCAPTVGCPIGLVKERQGRSHCKSCIQRDLIR